MSSQSESYDQIVPFTPKDSPETPATYEFDDSSDTEDQSMSSSAEVPASSDQGDTADENDDNTENNTGQSMPSVPDVAASSEQALTAFSSADKEKKEPKKRVIKFVPRVCDCLSFPPPGILYFDLPEEEAKKMVEESPKLKPKVPGNRNPHVCSKTYYTVEFAD